MLCSGEEQLVMVERRTARATVDFSDSETLYLGSCSTYGTGMQSMAWTYKADGQ